MNSELIEIFKHRATIIENLEGLHSYGTKFLKNKNQLSLFGDSSEAKISLIEPKNINYVGLADAEKESLGVYLTYNPFDSFILIKERFCNNTIESLLDVSDDSNGNIVLLARVNEIKNKKSVAGNYYSKLMIGDGSSNFMVYLWGKKYQELISSIYLNKIYLIELGFKKDGNTFYVVNMRNAEEIQIENFVKKIRITIDRLEDIEKVRTYVFKNMIGSKYNLIFIYDEIEYDAPYKINFTGDDYYYLKKIISKINVQK